jgi:hypothetical protein
MTTSLRRIALVLLVLLLGAVAFATVGDARPARRAAHVVVRAPQLTADPGAVQPGATLTLVGRGFPRNVHVALLAGPSQDEAIRVGGARTGLRGRFSATIHIRPHSRAGHLVALACHDGCRVKASAPFRIVAP